MIKFLILSLLFTHFAYSQDHEFLNEESVKKCIDKKPQEIELKQALARHSEMQKLFDDDLVPPVKDQDSIGWCYAMTSADLVSNFMARKSIAPYKKGDFKNKNRSAIVSGDGIAHAYNAGSMDKEYSETIFYNKKTKSAPGDKDKKSFTAIANGGETNVALKKAISKGVCFEDQLSSEDTLLPELKSKTKQILTGIKYNRTDDTRQLYNSLYYSDLDANCKADILKIFDPSLSNEVIDIISKLQGREALAELSKHICPNKTIISPTPKIVSVEAKGMAAYQGEDWTNFTDNTKVVESLNKGLSDGKIVSIDWDAGLMFNRSEKNKIYYPHASIVVGRTLDKDCKPSYVIKNSYGEHIDNLPSPCSGLVTNKKLSCEGGYIIVPEEELKMSLFGAVYLE
jgi:hypothetical protein